MAHSGRQRPRDRDPGRRRLDEADSPPANRVFHLTDLDRQHIASCLRGIDDAREALEAQHRPENRAILRELKAGADQIYEIITELEISDD